MVMMVATAFCLLFHIPTIMPFLLYSLPQVRYFQGIEQNRLFENAKVTIQPPVITTEKIHLPYFPLYVHHFSLTVSYDLSFYLYTLFNYAMLVSDPQNLRADSAIFSKKYQ